MNHFIKCLSAILLLGCAAQEFNYKDLHTVPLSKDVPLNLDYIWPIEGEGEYLQQVTANVKDQTHSLSIYLKLDPNKVQAIALHDLQGRVYDMTLTSDGLTWSCVPEIKDKLQPDYILADFLLTHLSLKTLKKCLKDVDIQETIKNNERTRILKKGGNIFRTIITSNHDGHIWKTVTINNPEFGYVLSIETVNQ